MRIGVTGIYASGKGTVCSEFEKLGGIVIDTDEISREIVYPGSDILKSIVKTFGEEFLNTDGTLDRRALGEHVFVDMDRVQSLNALVHPVILEIVKERTEIPGIYFINVPLLFESGFDRFMDYTVVVTASEEQVLSRGHERDGLDLSEIRKRLSFQIPLNEKIKLADYIIDNSGSLENTRRQVGKIWNSLKDLKEK